MEKGSILAEVAELNNGEHSQMSTKWMDDQHKMEETEDQDGPECCCPPRGDVLRTELVSCILDCPERDNGQGFICATGGSSHPNIKPYKQYSSSRVQLNIILLYYTHIRYLTNNFLPQNKY